MTTGPEIRPLLPQKFAMQTYSFAPPNLGLGDNKKNYVFVDEHNRHKRLKVMRACEGCRRRKIKCDAATSNQWPCAACVRLKLHCVPPTVNYERTHSNGGRLTGLESVLDFDTSNGSGEEDYHPQTGVQHYYDGVPNPQDMQPSHGSFNNGMGAFHTPPYSDRAPSMNDSFYDDVPGINLRPEQSFQEPPSYAQVNGAAVPTGLNGSVWTTEQFSAAELSDVLGELKINENGEAPYIKKQKKSLAEAPALEEFEVKLPVSVSGSGSTVRIPPELMPSEDQCMEWFEIFFTHVHPYVPVISKPYFYQQWRTNRKSISPLILEAIFACAGRMSDDPAQGAQWLALASKHEDCFMDVPRLSTIQALLLLLKARESAPKRGYYYRSWMTVKTIVALAKDLDLHEHYAEHQAGHDCGSDPTECRIKTRIWQTIFVCEMMIGGPQGRFDMGVATDTVDFGVPRPTPGIADEDYQVSRQFTYLVRMVKNVRTMSDIYAKIKRQKDWGGDPRFANLVPELQRWLDELPRDLQITFPEDGSAPFLPSHFVGNMHSYYHLTNIMLHRPQLMATDSFTAGGQWKQHMASCYDSAKQMCRLQEGILQAHNISGVVCMQRGINFIIYAVLSCTMIHLVAITSPDPDFNRDAKDYFTRHMRILEDCTQAWPMPEMQTQIDALREAFSADINRPFELRPTFPYGSPGGTLGPSPPLDVKYQSLSRQTSHEMPYHAQPMTPPVSAGLEDHRDRQIGSSPQSTILVNGQQQSVPMTSTSMSHDQMNWNPKGIFDQWNNAFGPPASTMNANAIPLGQPSPPLYTPTSMAHSQTLQDNLQQSQSYPMPSPTTLAPSTMAMSQMQQPISHMPAYATPSFVTSSMWRDTVASTFDPGGNKRRWDVESPFLIDSPQSNKRPR